jgi:hypothetical protein
MYIHAKVIVYKGFVVVNVFGGYCNFDPRYSEDVRKYLTLEKVALCLLLFEWKLFLFN